MSFGRDVDELRGSFDDLRKRLDRLCKTSASTRPTSHDGAAWSQAFKDETSLRAAKLLRSLESATTDAELMADAATRLNAARLVQEVDAFRVAVEGQVLMRVPSTDRVAQTVTRAFGLPTGGHITNYVLKALDAEDYCRALRLLNGARGMFLSALEDIRMLYVHRLLPVEERDKIRQALVNTGMPEVAERMAKADEQRVDDPGACVGHCRQSLVLTIQKLAEVRVGRGTGRVALDLAELQKTSGFMPPDEGKLVEALFHFLSTNWKAGEPRGQSELTPDVSSGSIRPPRQRAAPALPHAVLRIH